MLLSNYLYLIIIIIIIIIIIVIWFQIFLSNTFNLYTYMLLSNYLYLIIIIIITISYLPTPPLGQDMTQGQFLSEV